MPPRKEPARAQSEQRIAEVKQLLQMFAMERIVYIVITGVSALVLLSCAGYMLFTGKGDLAILVGLFGPSGALMYSTGRLLRMWSEALRVIYPLAEPAKEETQ